MAIPREGVDGRPRAGDQVEALRGWGDAPAIILSCPGPLRRHDAALIPVAGLVLPQVLLGSESQLLAFVAAAAKTLVGRLFFAPMPEMFAGVASLRGAWQAVQQGGGERIGARAVHLRFGPVRSARVLKGIRNGAVIAEAAAPPPLTASHHPFASGLVLPAAMRRVFITRSDGARPRAIGGGTLPASLLPGSLVTADLGRAGEAAGLAVQEAAIDLASILDFRSAAWAAGRVGPRGIRARLAAVPEGTQQHAGPSVLLPWNLDHPGSIVPLLLERLVKLHVPGVAGPRIILLPFNYVGQTGLIRRLIVSLRQACLNPEAALGDFFLARVTNLEGVAALRRLAGIAWIDGNDPEHGWTMARLAACSIGCILIDPTPGATQAALPANIVRLPADETIWVEAETRCGALTFSASLPSPRALPRLLAMSTPRDATAGRPRRARNRAALSV